MNSVSFSPSTAIFRRYPSFSKSFTWYIQRSTQVNKGYSNLAMMRENVFHVTQTYMQGRAITSTKFCSWKKGRFHHLNPFPINIKDSFLPLKYINFYVKIRTSLFCFPLLLNEYVPLPNIKRLLLKIPFLRFGLCHKLPATGDKQRT